MRFLFGLALGLLIPLAVRAMKSPPRPVALEPIRGGLAEGKAREHPPVQAGSPAQKAATSQRPSRQIASGGEQAESGASSEKTQSSASTGSEQPGNERGSQE